MNGLGRCWLSRIVKDFEIWDHEIEGDRERLKTVVLLFVVHIVPCLRCTRDNDVRCEI